MCFVISNVLLHLYYLICVMITCCDFCDVFQGAWALCIFNMFLRKCNRICVDKSSNLSFSEIKAWAGTYLNPSRAQLAQERRNMCRSREITLRARANESNISQAFVSLPASFYQETSSTREFHETSKPHGICNHNNLLSSWICVRLVLLLSTCWPIR